MSQSPTQSEPAIPRDTYPVMRVATEHFLRSVEVLSEVDRDLVSSLIFATLWRGQIRALSRTPVGVRELSRKLGLPYETVRRHARALERRGQCVEEKGGLVIPADMMRSPKIAAMLRKSYVNTVRMLRDLTRIGVARFSGESDRRSRSGRLTKQQIAIGVAGIGLLLNGLKILNEFAGDFVKGLVFTAIWTANVRHVTNTPAGGERGVLRDDQRLPVSVLAISNALQLPYETVRRHADMLRKDGVCIRVGHKGLVVPATTHRQGDNVGTMVAAYHDVMAVLVELRKAGIRV